MKEVLLRKTRGDNKTGNRGLTIVIVTGETWSS
jgi:hypothetical protein